METPQLPDISHHVDIQSRFNDFDMFGHLNNNSYLEYCDLAKTRYFEQLLGGPVNPERLSVVVANINADFHAPTLPGEPLRVDTRLIHIGESAITLEQWVINATNNHVKAVVSTVMVAFDIHTLKSTPIPEPLLSRLLADLNH